MPRPVALPAVPAVPGLPALPALPRLLVALAVLLVPALGTGAPEAQAQEAPFLPLVVDQDENQVLMEIPADRMDQDFLYMNTLATGLGQTSPLLDRGQVGMQAVVRLERRGQRVLMVRDNWGVRAPGTDPLQEQAVAESFPRSVVASFPIREEEGGQLVVDATSFFYSDVFGVGARLPGNYSIDRSRSWIDEDGSGNFPLNSELRVVLTYTAGSGAGPVNQVSPDGSAPVFEQHHSLVALPEDDGFRPRAFDPRAGLFGTSFLDFSQGIDGTYRNAYTNRWRLIPSDPEAYARGELVEPVEPIVFYMDPAIPEPYRTAFMEGGLWWNGIFEAAGFRDAFRLEELPEGANPLDARYNVIYWVHRRDPGPSVGPSFRDPRTGEILKTVVRMDSHRSLVDYNIWRGFIPAAGGADQLNMSAEDFTMIRRRQHTAHEIGHTLGLAHNFISASQGRASVMDYPAPLVSLDAQGNLDLSDSYRDEGGAWDSLSVRYAYTWFETEEEEAEGLARIMEDGLDEGLRFITGGHAGQAGSIPAATQWIEGATMMEATERTMAVRELLVDRFDETAIEPGEPMSMLNMRFAHVYLHHRYALEGLVKYVGGMEFSYALRGDGQVPAQPIPAAEQRRALTMVLGALEPEQLRIPDRVNDLIPPQPYGSDGSERWIGTAAGTAFDPISLAGGLATEIVSNLLHPQRAHRLAIFHSRDADMPSLHEVLETLVEFAWAGPASPAPGDRALQRVVERVVLDQVMDLASDGRATPEVRAAAAHHVTAMGDLLDGREGTTPEDRAHVATARRDIDRFLEGRDDPGSRPRYPVVPLPWP
ncbi:MAG: DUF5117 domain-containing protein [Gemmatimonadales bacterium]|nr:MAG: DUF5117 domain-containing protein [Gemmatimonadales bacterium]